MPTFSVQLVDQDQLQPPHLAAFEPREAPALAVDVVAEGAVVAVAPLLAVHPVRPRRARVRAHAALKGNKNLN